MQRRWGQSAILQRIDRLEYRHSFLRQKFMFKALLVTCIAACVARADFALKDGDTLAFFGDSITAARGYTKVVEHYTLMRYPDRKIRFVNAGEGGDTAQKSLKRLQSDVFDKGATVVTVALGINDIGWGTQANEEHKKLYLDGIRTIIEECQKRNIRPIICSAAVTAGDPDEGEKSFLQAMNDEAMAMAKSMGAGAIDLQREMRAVQRTAVETNKGESDPTKHTRLHVSDGIHLDELGQLAMGYAMLKGLGAPELVSSAEIDAKDAAVKVTGCKVTDVEKKGDGVRFVRLDEGLPVTFGPISALQFRWVPFPKINNYRLVVKNLKPGNYEIFADGRSLGKESAERLAEGLNLTNMSGDPWEPGGPWDVQSCIVKELVDARDKVWMGGKYERKFADPKESGMREVLKTMEDDIVKEQWKAAKPRAYQFEVVRLDG